MPTIQELLGNPSKETVAKAAEEAVAYEVGDVEQLWDIFRANFRGTDIRPAIREAANPLDMRAVLIVKVEEIQVRAKQLVAVLGELQGKSVALLEQLRTDPKKGQR